MIRLAKKTISILLVAMAMFSAQAKDNSRDTIFINLVEKLAKYAGKSNVLVKMKPVKDSFNHTVTNFEENIKVINAGVGGNTTVDLLKRVDKDVIAKKPDLVIMMVGTNDMLNTEKLIDYKTYSANLELLIKKIKSCGSKLVLMNPIPADSVYLFDRHDKSLFKETPNEKIDKVGAIVKSLAMQNEVHFYDLNAEFKAMNLPLHNQDMFIRNQKNSGKKDGVHPTALGYRFIAQNVFHFLKENELLKPNQNIICFGDSITRGGREGGNYPAYLDALIAENKI